MMVQYGSRRSRKVEDSSNVNKYAFGLSQVHNGHV